MRRYVIHIPATISIVLEQDREPTNKDVLNEVGKYVTLKNGQDFDSDEFEIVDQEDIELDGQLTSRLDNLGLPSDKE